MLKYLMYIIGRLRRQYFMQIPENKDDLLKSRKYFTLDGITAISIMVLTTGAFLSGLLKALGVSDALNGIISAMPAFTNLVQPIGALIAQKLKKIKLFVCSLALLHRLLFGFLFFIPFIFPQKYNAMLFVLTLIAAYILGQVISPAAGDWLVSLIPQKVRGRYLGIRERLMIIISAIISLALGKMLDIFNMANNIKTGFIIIGWVIFILAIINFFALSQVKEFAHNNINSSIEKHGRLLKKEEEVKNKIEKNGFLKNVKMVFSHKSFKYIILINVLWCISVYIVASYFPIYLIGVIKLEYTYLMIVGLFVSLIRMALTKYWGKLADKTSWIFVLKIGILLLSINHFIHAFIIPQNAKWLYFINAFFSGIPLAVIPMAIFGIQFEYISNENRSVYIAFNGAISGIIGFLSAVVGGFILNFVQKNGFVIMGHNLYPQQLLMLLSAILLIITAIYINYVSKKCKVLKNSVDGTV